MDFKIIISQPAIDDLQHIVSYIAQHNPDAALRMGTELLKRTRLLASFPELGRHAPESDHPDVREIIYRSHRIFYRVNHEQGVLKSFASGMALEDFPSFRRLDPCR